MQDSKFRDHLELGAARPVFVSAQGPLEDSAFTKLQQGKLLWIGEPGRGPVAESTETEEQQTMKIPLVLMGLYAHA